MNPQKVVDSNSYFLASKLIKEVQKKFSVKKEIVDNKEAEKTPTSKPRLYGTTGKIHRKDEIRKQLGLD